MEPAAGGGVARGEQPQAVCRRLHAGALPAPNAGRRWPLRARARVSAASGAAQNDVSGSLLLTLGESDLEGELGVTSGIHRKRILLQFHKLVGSVWSAESSGRHSPTISAALWSTNSTAALSPRLHEGKGSHARGDEPHQLRVHTLEQSRDEGILPAHLASLGQHTAPPSDGGSAAGGGGFELVGDGFVRIMSLAEQKAALEQAKEQGAEEERKRVESEAAAKVAAEETQAAEQREKEERARLLQRIEAEEREKERLAQEKREKEEAAARQEAALRQQRTASMLSDRDGRLGLEQPPPSPAPRRTLSTALAEQMRESVAWERREATREAILGSDDAAAVSTMRSPRKLAECVALHVSQLVARRKGLTSLSLRAERPACRSRPLACSDLPGRPPASPLAASRIRARAIRGRRARAPRRST